MSKRARDDEVAADTDAPPPPEKKTRPNRVLVFMDLGDRKHIPFAPRFFFEMPRRKWDFLADVIRDRDQVVMIRGDYDMEFDINGDAIQWELFEEDAPAEFAKMRDLIVNDLGQDLRPPSFQLSCEHRRKSKHILSLFVSRHKVHDLGAATLRGL